MNKHVSKSRPMRELVLRVRCTADERAEWRRKASAEERSLSEFVRSVLSAEPMQRHVRPPEVDPELLAALGRLGGNLNQITRAINFDRKRRRGIDLVSVLTLLMVLDRQLRGIVREHSR